MIRLDSNSVIPPSLTFTAPPVSLIFVADPSDAILIVLYTPTSVSPSTTPPAAMFTVARSVTTRPLATAPLFTFIVVLVRLMSFASAPAFRCSVPAVAVYTLSVPAAVTVPPACKVLFAAASALMFRRPFPVTVVPVTVAVAITVIPVPQDQ